MTNLEILQGVLIAAINKEDGNQEEGNWFINEVGSNKEDDTILYFSDGFESVTAHFKSINHSGLAHCDIDEYIDGVEIVSEITLSREVVKDHQGSNIDYEYTHIHTIPYEALSGLGFTYEDLVFEDEDCSAEFVELPCEGRKAA